MDDTTFQTAIVKVNVHGIDIGIDFLSHVLGISRGLEDGVVDLVVPYKIGGESGEIALRLMHPLHCLQSRIANIVTLGRSDDTAMRQAEATPIVLREFISETLEDGDQRGAIDTFRALFAYLRRDIVGRRAHKHLSYDPLDILRFFAGDERLDERYRQRSLDGMIAQLERQRSFWGRLGAIFTDQKIAGEKL